MRQFIIDELAASRRIGTAQGAECAQGAEVCLHLLKLLDADRVPHAVLAKASQVVAGIIAASCPQTDVDGVRQSAIRAHLRVLQQGPFAPGSALLSAVLSALLDIVADDDELGRVRLARLTVIVNGLALSRRAHILMH